MHNNFSSETNDLCLLMKIFEIDQVSWVEILLCPIALKLEITVLFGTYRDSRDFHNSLGLPIISEYFASKNACFFYVINFNASYLDFLYNLLSIWSLDFWNFVNTLSLALNFLKLRYRTIFEYSPTRFFLYSFIFIGRNFVNICHYIIFW